MSEPASETPGTRTFEADGQTWIARCTGAGAAGSGTLGLARIEAVRFALASAAETPLREALLQRGGFEQLRDEELPALLAAARELSDGPPTLHNQTVSYEAEEEDLF